MEPGPPGAGSHPSELAAGCTADSPRPCTAQQSPRSLPLPSPGAVCAPGHHQPHCSQQVLPQTPGRSRPRSRVCLYLGEGAACSLVWAAPCVHSSFWPRFFKRFCVVWGSVQHDGAAEEQHVRGTAAEEIKAFSWHVGAERTGVQERPQLACWS